MYPRALEALKKAVRAFHALYEACRARCGETIALEREVLRLRRRVAELERENERLRREAERLRATVARLEAEASYHARFARELGRALSELRSELEGARRERRQLLEELERALDRLAAAERRARLVAAGLCPLPPFVQALCEHGLLRLAKAWALLGDERVLDYLDEDGYYALKLYRDVIVEFECPEPEPPEPRPLRWIL